MESVRTDKWHILPPCILSSSGNCGLVRCGDQYLLIDMGKSCRTTSDCAEIPGTGRQRLCWHPHHARALRPRRRAGHLPEKISHPAVRLRGYAGYPCNPGEPSRLTVDAIPVDGQTLEIGEFTVTSFPTSHDVPCCGYRVRATDGHVMALATDLGYLTPVSTG